MVSEKYTITDLNEFLNTGRIDPFLWMVYFSSTLDAKIPMCEDCLDFKNRSCPGGQDPVDCFLSR